MEEVYHHYKKAGWVNSTPDENMHLPAPNKFIPTDMSLKIVQEKVKFPVLLSRSTYSALWYKPDTLFSTPKAYVKIDFNCPYAGKSPEAEFLTHIFTQLLMDYLNEYEVGAAWNTANVHAGPSVAVFGLGAVGLACLWNWSCHTCLSGK